MKRLFIIPILAVLSFITLASCGDNDEMQASSVPSQVKHSFTTKFPEAQRTKWELKGTWFVADFTEKGIEKEAWFERYTGRWEMTEVDYEKDYSALPAAVYQALEAPEFTDYQIDDITYYERNADSFYVIEFDHATKADKDVIFAPDGKILNSIPDNGKDYVIIPTTDVTLL